MIHVVAILTTKPGQRETVLEAFRAIIPTVHAEEGCIAYEPTIDVPGSTDQFGPDTFVVIERWSSTETLAAHAAAPHMAEYGAKVGPMMASRAVHVLEAC